MQLEPRDVASAHPRDLGDRVIGAELRLRLSSLRPHAAHLDGQRIGMQLGDFNALWGRCRGDNQRERAVVLRGGLAHTQALPGGDAADDWRIALPHQ